MELMECQRAQVYKALACSELLPELQCWIKDEQIKKNSSIKNHVKQMMSKLPVKHAQWMAFL